MRKILTSGCSLTSGWAFNDADLERNWPNQLATRLGATITNVAYTGNDNTSIFLNFLEKISGETFDICLLQITSIDRILFSPNWNSTQMFSFYNMSNGFMTDEEYCNWYRGFLILNQHCIHWSRLLQIQNIVKKLNVQGKYIRFVNGLLDWDQELFTDPTNSKFLNRLIDIDNISDSEIDRLRNLVYNQTKSIDLDLWINPFNSFTDLQVDDILPTDNHPGLKSHDIFAELIFNYLRENKNA
jgi:hypothetical protein